MARHTSGRIIQESVKRSGYVVLNDGCCKKHVSVTIGNALIGKKARPKWVGLAFIKLLKADSHPAGSVVNAGLSIC